MKKIIVIGGGAAGMAAAIAAAENGCAATIYEKNEKLGKKIYITGKGRCNVTNDCDMEGLFDSVVTNSRFLYSAFYGFSNRIEGFSGGERRSMLRWSAATVSFRCLTGRRM